MPEKRLFSIEDRFGISHVVFSGRKRNGFFPALAVKLGFGISFMSAMARWVERDGKIYDISLIPSFQAQREVDIFIKKVRKARSLELRNTQVAMDYSAVANLVNLEYLGVQGEIAKEVDLSKLSNLKRLVGSHSTISNLKGLSQLPNLKVVLVYHASSKWVNSLPKNLYYLSLKGRIAKGFDLTNFEELIFLEFAEASQLDFTSLVGGSDSVKVLGLQDIKVIKGIERIPTLFPNLESIKYFGIERQILDELVEACQSHCDLEQSRDL